MRSVSCLVASPIDLPAKKVGRTQCDCCILYNTPGPKAEGKSRINCPTMNSKSATSFFQNMRQTLAITLSVLLVPLTAQLNLYAQPAPAYIPLNAAQLDQVVAPFDLNADA